MRDIHVTFQENCSGTEEHFSLLGKVKAYLTVLPSVQFRWRRPIFQTVPGNNTAMITRSPFIVLYWEVSFHKTLSSCYEICKFKQ